MNRHLGNGAAWCLSLPVAAALYAGMTISSAWRYHVGGGAAWKGRAYKAGNPRNPGGGPLAGIRATRDE